MYPSSQVPHHFHITAALLHGNICTMALDENCRSMQQLGKAMMQYIIRILLCVQKVYCYNSSPVLSILLMLVSCRGA